jgi:hypothetical protein
MGAYRGPLGQTITSDLFDNRSHRTYLQLTPSCRAASTYPYAIKSDIAVIIEWKWLSFSVFQSRAPPQRPPPPTTSELSFKRTRPPLPKLRFSQQVTYIPDVLITGVPASRILPRKIPREDVSLVNPAKGVAPHAGVSGASCPPDSHQKKVARCTGCVPTRFPSNTLFGHERRKQNPRLIPTNIQRYTGCLS